MPVTQKRAQGRERVSAEGLKDELTHLREEYSKAQHQAQHLTAEHTKLTVAHEEMTAHVKVLQESCNALRAEKSELKNVQLELESESAQAKQDFQSQQLAVSEELERTKQACTVLQNAVDEVKLFPHFMMGLTCSKMSS